MTSRLVFAVVLLGSCADDPEIDIAPAAAPTTLRIADWNIQENGEGTDLRTDLDRTYQTLRDKAANADIITCNECYASTITSFASRLTTDTGVTWHPVPQFDLGSHNHSGILSRYPLASTPQPFSYSQPASMDTGPKTAGEVDINVNGVIVHVIVTRLCYPCGGAVRAVQAGELVDWAKGFGEPRIIMGDFNDNPTAQGPTTMKASYIDSFKQAQSTGHANTYADNPSGLTHGCSRFDYVWLSNGAGPTMTLVDATVPDLRAPPLMTSNPAVKESDGCSDDYGVRPSDHDMIEATFTVAAQQQTAQLPAGWTAADVGAVGTAGSTSFSAGAFTIDAGGTSVYSTADAFHYVSQPWVGDGDIIARVDSINANGGTDAGAGVMFRQSTAAGSPAASMLVFASGKAKFRSRTTSNGDTTSTGPSAGDGPVRWVKLTRRGAHFEGFVSSDGVSWGSPISSADVAMSGAISIGLVGFREGNFTGPAGEAVLSSVALSGAGLPSPWRTADVGTIDVAGTTTFASGAFTIDAGGDWIWSTSDSFHFLHQPWRGDGTLIARIDSLTLGGGTDSAAGVIFRSDLTAGSPLATMLVFGTGKAKFRHRDAAGASIDSTCCSTGPSTGAGAPRWVKLTRTGNHFEGFLSTDGTSWGTAIGTADVALPSDLYVGVAVMREDGTPAQRAHAVVSNLSIQ